MTAKQYQRARRDLERIARQMNRVRIMSGTDAGILPRGVGPRVRRLRDELFAVAQLSI
jgi:hypothetical protein